MEIVTFQRLISCSKQDAPLAPALPPWGGGGTCDSPGLPGCLIRVIQRHRNWGAIRWGEAPGASAFFSMARNTFSFANSGTHILTFVFSRNFLRGSVGNMELYPEKLPMSAAAHLVSGCRNAIRFFVFKIMVEKRSTILPHDQYRCVWIKVRSALRISR